MLCKLSLKNIRRGRRDYLIYLFTLILGVAIFYVFNAVGTQAAFLKVSASSREIIELLKSILSGFSVFIAIVLGFLVVYAGSFLIRRRHGEFALYMLLGMGKGRVALLLAMETAVIGLLALAIGLAVGVLVSQLMSVLVARMFEADMTAFTFTFSGDAFLKTILYFIIILLVVMTFDVAMVGKYQLIELMQSGRRAEKAAVKNPMLCLVIFAGGLLLLGRAYWMVSGGLDRLGQAGKILIPAAMGGLATLLIFWSVSGFFLSLFRRFKHSYYRGINIFTFRQVSSRINTMVGAMTIICLMLFATICTLAAAFSLSNSLNRSARELAPADGEVMIFLEDAAGTESSRSPEQIFGPAGFDLQKNFTEYRTLGSYLDPSLTLADTLGGTLESAQSMYRAIAYDRAEEVVPVSEYNAFAELTGKPLFSLSENEYAVLSDIEIQQTVRNAALRAGTRVTVFGRELSPKYDVCQDGFLVMSANHETGGVILVPDSVTEGQVPVRFYLLGNFGVEESEEKEEAARLLAEGAGRKPEGMKETVFVSVQTREDILSAGVGLGAMVTFIALYLGIVFLVAGAAILTLKFLTDCMDSAERYRILRRIGVEESSLTASMVRQAAILFLLPLLLAVIHSVFGMRFAGSILEALGMTGMGRSFLLTFLVLAVVYGGYFLITCVLGQEIIREKE